MRLLLDEDVDPEVAVVARGLGLDVVSVHEIGRRGLSDQEQLRYAASEERIMVTRNRDDFIRLTVAFFRSAEPHAGVLIIPHTLPNRHPEPIAHALQRWCDERGGQGDPGAYLLNFLHG